MRGGIRIVCAVIAFIAPTAAFTLGTYAPEWIAPIAGTIALLGFGGLFAATIYRLLGDD
jgi:hypothetical protein